MNLTRSIGRSVAQLMLIGFYCQTCICLADWSNEDRLQEKHQLDFWQNKLLDNKNISPDIRIEELALGLRSMAFRKQFGGRDPKTDLVYFEIQKTMIAIPGHAEYYSVRILRTQERAKSIGPMALSEYSSEIMYGFQTLPLLPSPESVRVLGELLSNEWVPPGNETAPLSGKFAPLSVSARVTLQKFPLLDKPFTDQITKENVPDAQAAWLQWFEQIKAGKRTFRFEGDPTEYDLSGPAPGQKIAHILRGEKRDAERATRQKNIATQAEAKQSVSPDKKPSFISAVLASLILCVAAVWKIKCQTHNLI